MQTRREFIGSGLAAVGLAISARASARGQPCVPSGAVAVEKTSPVALVGGDRPVIDVGGLPFAEGFSGDGFDDTAIPFHSPENPFAMGEPPEPQEWVDIAVVGGGLAGLATAYVLREHRPVLFDLRSRFGGNSQGERWGDLDSSIGGAYLITPDAGTFLESLYRELGLDAAHRLSAGGDPVELEGRILDDFWSGAGRPPLERRGFREYARLVRHYANNYPEIPLPRQGNEWIRDLDRVSFRAHVERSLTVPVPTLLASAIQGYFYSSFGAGWEEVSAASGWNFVAAEEFGRWVFPGGNAALAGAMWERLRALEQGVPPQCPGRYLRAGCRVVEVRVRGRNRVQVTWRDSEGAFRSLMARRVVMACPKHVCKHVLHRLRDLDPQREEDMHHLRYTAYVVANVLLDRGIDRDFFDLFLLGDGRLPTGQWQVGEWSRATDAIQAAFAAAPPRTPAGLTFYWALPFPDGRFTLMAPEAWRHYAERIGAQAKEVLGLLGVGADSVRQVRLTRWGHAMPVAAPGLIADGVCERLRTPFQDHVFFVNQDNWALPAVETCLLEAEIMAPSIKRGL